MQELLNSLNKEQTTVLCGRSFVSACRGRIRKTRVLTYCAYLVRKGSTLEYTGYNIYNKAAAEMKGRLNISLEVTRYMVSTFIPPASEY